MPGKRKPSVPKQKLLRELDSFIDEIEKVKDSVLQLRQKVVSVAAKTIPLDIVGSLESQPSTSRRTRLNSSSPSAAARRSRRSIDDLDSILDDEEIKISDKFNMMTSVFQNRIKSFRTRTKRRLTTAVSSQVKSDSSSEYESATSQHSSEERANSAAARDTDSNDEEERDERSRSLQTGAANSGTPVKEEPITMELNNEPVFPDVAEPSSSSVPEEAVITVEIIPIKTEQEDESPRPEEAASDVEMAESAERSGVGQPAKRSESSSSSSEDEVDEEARGKLLELVEKEGLSQYLPKRPSTESVPRREEDASRSSTSTAVSSAATEVEPAESHSPESTAWRDEGESRSSTSTATSSDTTVIEPAGSRSPDVFNENTESDDEGARRRVIKESSLSASSEEQSDSPLPTIRKSKNSRRNIRKIISDDEEVDDEDEEKEKDAELAVPAEPAALAEPAEPDLSCRPCVVRLQRLPLNMNISDEDDDLDTSFEADGVKILVCKRNQNVRKTRRAAKLASTLSRPTDPDDIRKLLQFRIVEKEEDTGEESDDDTNDEAKDDDASSGGSKAGAKKKKTKKSKSLVASSDEEMRSGDEIDSGSEKESSAQAPTSVSGGGDTLPDLEDDDVSVASSDAENETSKKPKQEKVTPKKVKPEESDSSVENKPKMKTNALLNRINRLLHSSDEEGGSEASNVQRPKKMLKRRRESSTERSTEKGSVPSVPSSDESETEEDEEGVAGKKKKTKKKKSKPKKKRKRIVDPIVISSDTDDEANAKLKSPTKRKEIRDIMAKSELSRNTRDAEKAERERKKRVTEKQKFYNQWLLEVAKESPDVVGKVVLEFNAKKEPVLAVDEDVSKHLKRHQVEGIRFMWDSVYESLKAVKKGDPGGGCILAHCMGLGKTLQVIAFAHMLLTNPSTATKTVLVVCPLNTVLNWKHEFEKWLEDTKTDIEVRTLVSVKNDASRVDYLRHWQRTGGVMIIGYTLFRILAAGKSKKKAKHIELFQSALIDPGPDLVVCDEGHMLKNIKTSLSATMFQIKTKRRIILTGTPLQNNLEEYHCMVSFIKPSLLGTVNEFRNRFINPIKNGQCSDSTPYDVKVMKKRAHILHQLLDGCVQRKDLCILREFLPPKFEYIIAVRMSDFQCDLYTHYLNGVLGVDSTDVRELARSGKLFRDYQVMSRIWTHPWLLKTHFDREGLKESDSTDSFVVSDDHMDDKEEDSDVILLDDDDTASDSSNREEVIKQWTTSRRQGKTEEKSGPVEDTSYLGTWWGPKLHKIDPYDFEATSGKIVLFMEILRKCCEIGDKVIVFTQSILLLNFLEDILENATGAKCGGPWVFGNDYLRFDGTTNAETRKRYANLFNKAPRCRLFLISTKAGGLGINLVGANRIVVLDASWNPSNDTQAVFRSYRFGQPKPVYIYRFCAQGTMEEKIYQRQVTKLSLSKRVVDEHQLERHFSYADLQELYSFKPNRDLQMKEKPVLPKDRFLADIIIEFERWIVFYHEHDSLLENKLEEGLTEEERQEAWKEYEAEKNRTNLPGASVIDFLIDSNQITQLLMYVKERFPIWTDEEVATQVEEMIKRRRLEHPLVMVPNTSGAGYQPVMSNNQRPPQRPPNQMQMQQPQNYPSVSRINVANQQLPQRSAIHLQSQSQYQPRNPNQNQMASPLFNMLTGAIQGGSYPRLPGSVRAAPNRYVLPNNLTMNPHMTQQQGPHLPSAGLQQQMQQRAPFGMSNQPVLRPPGKQPSPNTIPETIIL